MPPEVLVVENEDPFSDDPDPSPSYFYKSFFSYKLEMKLFLVEPELLSSL